MTPAMIDIAIWGLIAFIVFMILWRAISNVFMFFDDDAFDIEWNEDELKELEHDD